MCAHICIHAFRAPNKSLRRISQPDDFNSFDDDANISHRLIILAPTTWLRTYLFLSFGQLRTSDSEEYMHLCIFLCGFFQAMIFSLNPSTTCCICILLRSYLTSDHQYLYICRGRSGIRAGGVVQEPTCTVIS